MDTKSHQKIERWFNGPDFLWKTLDPTQLKSTFKVEENDAEIKTRSREVYTISNVNDNSVMSTLEEKSDWMKIIRLVAYIRRFITSICTSMNKMKLRNERQQYLWSLDVKELGSAKMCIFNMMQQKYLSTTLVQISTHGRVPSNNALASLNPFLDDNNLLRVGGRLKNSKLNYHLNHPITILKASPISTTIIRWHHEKTFHSGRGITINDIRVMVFESLTSTHWFDMPYVNVSSAAMSEAIMVSRRWAIFLLTGWKKRHHLPIVDWTYLVRS